MSKVKNYTVRTKINRPVADVFSSVISRASLTKFFVNASSSDLVKGAKVKWTWDNYGSNDVLVKNIISNKLIELVLDTQNWQKTKDSGYEVTLSMEFDALDAGSTMVTICESGWLRDDEGYKGSHENCGGWQDMLLCLKGYLEYGIDLRA
jgi:uncharacterized protein YndB with AHSA1/START domain